MSRGPKSTNLDRTFGRHLAHQPFQAGQPLAAVWERLWRLHRRPTVNVMVSAGSSFSCPSRGARFASFLLAKEIYRQLLLRDKVVGPTRRRVPVARLGWSGVGGGVQSVSAARL